MMGEHSPCDALIPSIIVDFAIAEHINTEKWGLDDGAKGGWERLDWQVDETLQKEIGRAQQDAQKVIADSEPSQLWFGDYGAEWIKSVGESDLPLDRVSY